MALTNPATPASPDLTGSAHHPAADPRAEANPTVAATRRTPLLSLRRMAAAGVAALALTLGLVLPAVGGASGAQAATGQSAQWGSFVKNSAWNYASQNASYGLRANGFQQWGVTGNSVIGAKGDTVVVVSYSPEANYTRTAYTVTAVSPVSAHAELARNSVRTSIVNLVRID
jgi:hypothetical protein